MPCTPLAKGPHLTQQLLFGNKFATVAFAKLTAFVENSKRRRNRQTITLNKILTGLAANIQPHQQARCTQFLLYPVNYGFKAQASQSIIRIKFDQDGFTLLQAAFKFGRLGVSTVPRSEQKVETHQGNN